MTQIKNPNNWRNKITCFIHHLKDQKILYKKQSKSFIILLLVVMLDASENSSWWPQQHTCDVQAFARALFSIPRNLCLISQVFFSRFSQIAKSVCLWRVAGSVGLALRLIIFPCTFSPAKPWISGNSSGYSMEMLSNDNKKHEGQNKTMVWLKNVEKNH